MVLILKCDPYAMDVFVLHVNDFIGMEIIVGSLNGSIKSAVFQFLDVLISNYPRFERFFCSFAKVF